MTYLNFMLELAQWLDHEQIEVEAYGAPPSSPSNGAGGRRSDAVKKQNKGASMSLAKRLESVGCELRWGSGPVKNEFGVPLERLVGKIDTGLFHVGPFRAAACSGPSLMFMGDRRDGDHLDKFLPNFEYKDASDNDKSKKLDYWQAVYGTIQAA